MGKTLDDVLRVIAKGKPAHVVDAFVASYLAGAAWQAWEESLADSCPGDCPDSLPEMAAPTEADLAAWKRAHYADLRRAAYPSLGDQMDALWKGGADAEEMAERVAAVKAAWPKLGM